MPKYYAVVCICISKESTQRGTGVVGIYVYLLYSLQRPVSSLKVLVKKHNKANC